VQISFFGGAKSVTGALYLVESGGRRILIDCGMFQGSRLVEEENYKEFPFDPKSIEAVFVTHAHLDHTGRLPQLFKTGFRGAIFSTPPTRDFADLILQDTTDLIMREAQTLGRDPLWNHNDHWGAMRLFHTINYHEKVEVAPDFFVTGFDAGHILGSTFYLIEADDKRIVFSGDLGNPPVVMLHPTEPLPETDTVVMEAAYGNRIHEPIADRKELLEDIIEDTVRQKGVLMIPAFAIERTQELLFDLHTLMEERRIPRVPVFLDSPLAIKATEVYKKNIAFMSDEARKIISEEGDIFKFPGLTLTLTKEESKAINDVPAPKIIIAGAGMSNGGRILHHERRYLPDPKSTLLIVGYQAKGSLGRRILEGAKEVEIFDERVPVRCRVEFLAGFSAHADQNQLLGWLAPKNENLKEVFLVQGDDDAMEELATLIRDRLAVEVEVPDPGAVKTI